MTVWNAGILSSYAVGRLSMARPGTGPAGEALTLPAWYSALVPCSPRASTTFHIHSVYDSLALQPSLWATDALIASSFSVSPTAVVGDD